MDVHPTNTASAPVKTSVRDAAGRLTRAQLAFAEALGQALANQWAAEHPPSASAISPPDVPAALQSTG